MILEFQILTLRELLITLIKLFQAIESLLKLDWRFAGRFDLETREIQEVLDPLESFHFFDFDPLSFVTSFPLTTIN